MGGHVGESWETESGDVEKRIFSSSEFGDPSTTVSSMGCVESSLSSSSSAWRSLAVKLRPRWRREAGRAGRDCDARNEPRDRAGGVGMGSGEEAVILIGGNGEIGEMDPVPSVELTGVLVSYKYCSPGFGGCTRRPTIHRNQHRVLFCAILQTRRQPGPNECRLSTSWHVNRKSRTHLNALPILSLPLSAPPDS